MDVMKWMLGVFLAVDENNDTQVADMRKIAEELYKKVRAGHLTRYNTWTILNYTILKTLKYLLLALTLTEEECIKIMAPILTSALPNIGTYISSPRKLVYGTIKN